jgi:hypothetical protein
MAGDAFAGCPGVTSIELWSSVTEIAADASDASDAEAEYYDLSGNRVAAGQLMPGVYVKLQNGRTEKVLVK